VTTTHQTILSELPNVEPDREEPERRLWKAVIDQAEHDCAAFTQHGSTYQQDHDTAWYFLRGSERFLDVCLWLDLDPLQQRRRSAMAIAKFMTRWYGGRDSDRLHAQWWDRHLCDLAAVAGISEEQAHSDYRLAAIEHGAVKELGNKATLRKALGWLQRKSTKALFERGGKEGLRRLNRLKYDRAFYVMKEET